MAIERDILSGRKMVGLPVGAYWVRLYWRTHWAPPYCTRPFPSLLAIGAGPVGVNIFRRRARSEADGGQEAG